MNLVGNKVSQLEHVNHTHNNWVLECFTSAAIVESRLTSGSAVFTITNPSKSFDFLGFTHKLPDFRFRNTVKNWGSYREAEGFSSNSEVSFKNLSNVHSRWHAEWVQADLHWSSVTEVRHVFFGNDSSNNSFVTVTTGHLVTNAELALSSNKDFNLFDGTWVNFLTAFKLIKTTLTIGIKLTEAAFECSDDLKNLVTNRGWINLNVIVD